MNQQNVPPIVVAMADAIYLREPVIVEAHGVDQTVPTPFVNTSVKIMVSDSSVLIYLVVHTLVHSGLTIIFFIYCVSCFCGYNLEIN